MGKRKAGKKGKTRKGQAPFDQAQDRQGQTVQTSDPAVGTIRGNQQLRLRRRAIGERIREVSDERDRLSRIWHVTEGSGRWGLGLQIEVLADELGALIAMRNAVRDPDDPTWEPPVELDEVPAGLARLGCQASVPDYLKPTPVEATGQAQGQPVQDSEPVEPFGEELSLQAEFNQRLTTALLNEHLVKQLAQALGEGSPS